MAWLVGFFDSFTHSIKWGKAEIFSTYASSKTRPGRGNWHDDTGEGTVADIISVREGLQIVTVWMRSGELERAVHYTDTLPLLAPGDVVDLNVTAMKLGLGSGGFHIVISIRDRGLDNHSTTSIKWTHYEAQIYPDAAKCVRY